jgi:DNA-binding MarR family transcriptional regulator
MNNYDALKLENQLCFPLYACSREIIKLYKPFLNKIDLTYTQYITLMVLWDIEEITVKELGKKLYLDSGTLTPLLKKLESKGLVKRKRSEKDERIMIITITEEGKKLKEKAVDIPKGVFCETHLDREDAMILKEYLNKLLQKIDK